MTLTDLLTISIAVVVGVIIACAIDDRRRR